MARRDIEDIIRLHVRTGPDQFQDRWWRIEQPVPSVALTLRGRIGAALGPAADQALLMLLRNLEPGGAEDMAQDERSVGDALALATFQRARSGRRVVDPSEPADLAAGRLLALAAFVARHSGAGLDTTLLLGEHERQDQGRPGHRWPKPALLYRLLMDSQLAFGGTGQSPRWPSGMPAEEAPGGDLLRANLSGSIGAHIDALDSLVSGPDELLLLVAWALLHLWRPF